MGTTHTHIVLIHHTYIPINSIAVQAVCQAGVSEKEVEERASDLPEMNSILSQAGKCGPLLYVPTSAKPDSIFLKHHKYTVGQIGSRRAIKSENYR